MITINGANYLVMADSINPQALLNLPVPVDCFLGYRDGRWPDYQAISQQTTKPVFGLTVFGNTQIKADGVDSEPGDATISQAVAAIKAEIGMGVWRPIAYCPASWGDSMLNGLLGAGLSRTSFRLLSAHYSVGQHICGPKTCGLIKADYADGTQWIDHGTWDESLLQPTFLNTNNHGGLMLKNCVGAAATSTGKGLWFVQADGAVFAVGDAKYMGGVNNVKLSAPIVGIVSTPDDKGYTLIGADGGQFNFGDSHYLPGL